MQDKRTAHVGPRGGKYCSRCQQRPPRQPRGWNRPDVKVSGPALCRQCARQLVSNSRAAAASPSQDL